MLNSMEGKRGEPRNKRFFPTRTRLPAKAHGRSITSKPFAPRPESCSWESIITLQTGTSASPGTKLLSVSGDCRLPGIYEIEWGTTVREILKNARPTGPISSRSAVPPASAFRWMRPTGAIALDDLVSEGSIMIFSRSRDILNILRNYNHFFKHESCGLCTPCRAGNLHPREKTGAVRGKTGTSSRMSKMSGHGERS